MRWARAARMFRLRRLVAAAGAVAGLAALCAMWLAMTLPDVRLLTQTNPAVTGYMEFREATAGAPQVRHSWVPLDNIASVLACTVVRSEDAWFFRHGPVDWRQLVWAGGQLLKGRTQIGTSTITQQLARNLYLTPERSILRKIREVAIAASLERHLSKARILELYLNVVEWGDGIWGIGDASRHYFGRTPPELSLFDSTVLASLLPAPLAALEARNRVRAFRLQTDLLWDLQATGLIEGADSSSVFNRINLLHLGLQSGEPITAAVRRQIDRPIDDGSSMRGLNVRELLSQECGLTWSAATQTGKWLANAPRSSRGAAHRGIAYKESTR
jgi:monofunctional biosynthetic peptidoglycan transglycosylase